MKRFLFCLTVLFFAHAANAAEVQKIESSGLSALLIQETSVPAFTLKVSFKHSGHAWQKPDKQGLANLASMMMNEGAGNLDSQNFQRTMEQTGIRLYGSADSDMFTITLQSLSEQREKAMELLLLAITQPRFDDEAIKRMRDEILNDIARLEGKTSFVAARAWWKAAYPNHPYGLPSRGTPETLNSITRADLKQFAKDRFAKDSVMIAAAGDIAPEEIKKLLDELAKRLPEKSSGVKAMEKIQPLATGEVIHIEREVPQSVVEFGLPGVSRKDPRFYTAFVLNFILGGGELSSRLMDALRQEKGLIYAVSTDLTNMENTSLLTGMLASSNETVEQAVNETKAQLKLIGEKGVTAVELEEAKAFLTGAFPLNMDSNEALVSYLMSIQLYDLGLDFFHTRNDQINRVTIEDINAMAKELFKDKNPIIIVAGKSVAKPANQAGGPKK